MSPRASTDGRFPRPLARAAAALALAAAVVAGPGLAIAATSAPAPARDPAPALSPGAASVSGLTSFLWTGPRAEQRGVAAGAIDPRRVSVLRGRVLDAAGEPLARVRVRVLGHPEYGAALTSGDGTYDVAVNGGAPVVLDLYASGRLPAQRRVQTGWQEIRGVADVRLTRPDEASATIEPTSGPALQVYRSTPRRDSDGERRATLMFAPGTRGTAVLAGGGRRDLGAMTVRATEYSVGANGPERMPGTPPPGATYAYAVDYGVAAPHGSVAVRFSRPVIAYTEDFLDLPTGGTVPAGRYDRVAGRWSAAGDARVVRIADVEDGRARLDTGAPDGASESAASARLGVTPAELTALARIYRPGTRLLRLRITRSGPYALAPAPAPAPRGAAAPEGAGGAFLTGTPGESPCPAGIGTEFGCERQRADVRIPLAGTSLDLRYGSDRGPSYLPDRAVDVAVTGQTIPGPLRRVELSIEVAGRRLLRSFPPRPGQRFRWVWDGRDAWGRRVPGAALARVTLTNVYPQGYRTTAASSAPGFGVPGGGAATGTAPGRRESELRLARTVVRPLGAPDPRQTDALGGFTLDAHDVYDPVARAVFAGDGTVIGGAGAWPSAARVAGGGSVKAREAAARALPATAASVPLENIAAGPDGTIYLPDSERVRIYAVTPGGRLRAFAGTGPGDASSGDGGPAARARLGRRIVDVATGPDGSVYVLAAVGPATASRQEIRRIAPGGRISTVAGDLGPGASADGIGARRARIDASAIAVGSDGSIYLDDYALGRLRRIAPGGRIDTLAGGGEAAVSPSPQPARSVRLSVPARPAPAPDGSIYLANEYQNRVLRLAPDGTIAVAAGTGDDGPGPASGNATDIAVPAPRHLGVAPDGTLYIASAHTGDSGRAPIVAVTPGGMLAPFAGNSACARHERDAVTIPLSECFTSEDAMTVLPDGELAYAGAGGVLRLTGSPFPGSGAARIRVPVAGGRSVDIFDGRGRQIARRDALTGAVRRRFLYDRAGRLAGVTDASGATTRVERARDGRPVAIVAPGGERTALSVGGDGGLVGVSGPRGRGWRLGYAAGSGLLTSVVRPAGGVSEMRYDGRGLLTRLVDPDEVRLDLVRDGRDDAVSVAATDGDGRTTTYRYERRRDGIERRAVTNPAGGVDEVLRGTDGVERRTGADGTTIVQRFGPDPRFGLMAPVVRARTVSSPAGRATALARTRTATYGRSGILRLRERVTVDGAASTWSYDYRSRTARLRTAGGRHWEWRLDRFGRVVAVSPPGEAEIRRRYDARGRLVAVTQGPVALRIAAGRGGRVVLREGGSAMVLRRDGAGRLRALGPPGARTRLAYDAGGRQVSVTLPRGGRYLLARSPGGRDRGYTAPGATAGQARTFTPGGRVERETFPSGRSVAWSLDPAGRLAGRAGGGVATSYAWAGDTDRLATLIRTAPPTGGSAPPEPAATLALAYDGGALTHLTWGGPFDARATLGRDGAGRLTSIAETIAGASAKLAVPHDADGLATGIGPFRFTRRGPGGRVTRAAAGGLRARFGFDALGRPTSRAYAVAGAGVVWRQTLSYDAASRVSRTTVTARDGAGRSRRRTLTYAYDGASRLAAVRRGRHVLERYGWDADGNRTSRRLGGAPAQTTTYDLADRIVNHGGIRYGVNADGFVTRRGGDTFAYTADGELMRAVVGGRTIDYRYDGLGRRVSRAADEEGTIRYVYDDPRDAYRLTATIDPGGGVTRYLYGGDGLLMAIARGGRRYLVATDVDGTPRLVAAEGGPVVRLPATDSFGRPLAGLARPALPLAVGFGGGLADPDTGLVRLGVRDYDPETGRYTAPDPALFDGGDTNVYAYAGGNPVGRRDPTGLACVGDTVPDGLAGFSPCAGTTGRAICDSGRADSPAPAWPADEHPADIGLAGVPAAGLRGDGSTLRAKGGLAYRGLAASPPGCLPL